MGSGIQTLALFFFLEISKSGALDDDNSDEIVFGAKATDNLDDTDKPKPVDSYKRNLAKPHESGKRQALSVLSVLSSQQKPEARLSFSGLFPKSTTPLKTANSCPTFFAGDDSDLKNECDLKKDCNLESETPLQSTSKRKRIDSEIR